MSLEPDYAAEARARRAEADRDVEAKLAAATDRFNARQALEELIRRGGDAPFREPPHCSECFEGCPKCQPDQ